MGSRIPTCSTSLAARQARLERRDANFSVISSCDKKRERNLTAARFGLHRVRLHDSRLRQPLLQCAAGRSAGFFDIRDGRIGFELASISLSSALS